MAFPYSPISPIFTPTDIFLSDSVMSPSSPFHPLSPLSPLNHVYSPASPGPLTLSLEFSRPLVGVYESIDNNPEVRKKMIDYYYDLIRDEWLLGDLNDILNYVVYKDGHVSLIKNLSEYNPNNIAKDTDTIAEKKVEWLEKNVFTKYNLTDVLIRFTKESNTKFVDLPKNQTILKDVIEKYIIREIKKKLKGKHEGGAIFF